VRSYLRLEVAAIAGVFFVGALVLALSANAPKSNDGTLLASGRSLSIQAAATLHCSTTVMERRSLA
jgi:hypothetical protein